MNDHTPLDDEDGEIRCVLAFDTEEPEFARGFEAGRVWEMVKNGEPFSQTISSANAEMMLRMAESVKAPFSATVLDDDWVEVEFGPSAGIPSAVADG